MVTARITVTLVKCSSVCGERIGFLHRAIVFFMDTYLAVLLTSYANHLNLATGREQWGTEIQGSDAS